MCGYSTKEFVKLLTSNGWRLNRSNGSHHTYSKDGVQYIVTFPNKRGELPRPMIQRLIKEAGIKVN